MNLNSDQPNLIERKPDLDTVKELLSWTESLYKFGARDKLNTDPFVRARGAITDSLSHREFDSVADTKCLLALDASTRVVQGYASLHCDHLSNVLSTIQSVKNYVADESLQRPHNFMMLATPGAGKNHLVDCIAREVGGNDIGVVAFNLATMESKADLVSILDAARNMVVDRKIPLIFLDEFDSNVSNYALLLPLLWDGKLDLGSRTLKIGRSVFFLAGSSSALSKAWNDARQCRAKKNSVQQRGKVVDLMSRISGSDIRIPAFLSRSTVSPDKVVLAVNLLRRRFSKCLTVPKRLLRFVACAGFQYGARSIAAFVNAIPLPSNRRAVDVIEIEEDQLKSLPLSSMHCLSSSSLAVHLYHRHNLGGLIELWNDCCHYKSVQHIHHPALDSALDSPSRGLTAATSILETAHNDADRRRMNNASRAGEETAT